MYRVVLLDIDGTLVDSNDAHAHAWVKVFAAHGRRVEFSRVRPLIGKGGDKLLAELVDVSSESDEGKALSDGRRAIFEKEYLPTLMPTRGAQPLLERLHAEGLHLAVATSAQAAEVKSLLEIAHADKLIDTASSSDDAEESKPDPDIIQAALQQAKCEPADAIMLGDTPYDIEAAARAGVATIALRCGGWWKDEDFAGAVAIYDDPEDLLRNYERSPLNPALAAGNTAR